MRMRNTLAIILGTFTVLPLSGQMMDPPQEAFRLQTVPHAPLSSRDARKPLVAETRSALPTVTQLCHPFVSDNIIVATPEQRKRAGDIALPPLTDDANGFAWPDTELGVIKNEHGYAFFGSDGGYHARQDWEGLIEGNNKGGSVTRTLGSLSDPLGTEAPIDVSIKPNPDPAVNPFYSSYD